MAKNVVPEYIYYKVNQRKCIFSLDPEHLFILTLAAAAIITNANSRSTPNTLQPPENRLITMQHASPPQKPEITYPCLWSYKIIGEDQDFLREALLVACAPHPVAITHSHTSSGGRYHSMEGKLVVQDEATRLAIFDALKTHPAVKILF